MDYEKAYKDIQAEIKQIYEKPVSAMFKGHYFNGYVETGIRDAMMALMPNLAEIEDERIRKHIIELVKQSSNILCKKTQDAMIDYLEKQKEQISSIDAICLSAGIPKPYKDGNQWCILKGDNIQDGIAGFGNTKEDALVDFIRNIPIEKQKEPKEELFVRINGLINEYIKAGADEAEQEHRLKCYHLFLDSLEDAEYFEQKEQKPLSTEETELNSIAFLEQLGYTCIPPGEQKPTAEWSERDKDMLNSIIATCQLAAQNSDSGPARHLLEMQERFLNSLRPVKQEWSEEDEEHLDSIIESYKELLKDYKACHDIDYIPYNSDTVIRNVVDDVNFLKSLRPQPHWKPSEEQMKALYTAACESSIIKENGNYLYDLYDDLKNLK